jgi:hypothetical protein
VVEFIVFFLSIDRKCKGNYFMKSGQSKTMSLVESSISVIAGYILTVLIQYWLYPLFGISIPAKDALVISGIIVLVAFIKNFSVRRIFNFLYIRHL